LEVFLSPLLTGPLPRFLIRVPPPFFLINTLFFFSFPFFSVYPIAFPFPSPFLPCFPLLPKQTPPFLFCPFRGGFPFFFLNWFCPYPQHTGVSPKTGKPLFFTQDWVFFPLFPSPGPPGNGSPSPPFSFPLVGVNTPAPPFFFPMLVVSSPFLFDTYY